MIMKSAFARSITIAVASLLSVPPSHASPNALNPADVIGGQMRAEKHGNRTGLLSRDFKASYNKAPEHEEYLGLSVFSGGYDVPDKILNISHTRYDNPDRASAKATLHYINENAPKPSFNRDVLIVFVNEGGQWKIDNIRLISQESAAMRRSGRELWLKRKF